MINNNEISSKEIESSKNDFSAYSGMNIVGEHTGSIIDAMENGEKISVKDLADKVSDRVRGIENVRSGNILNLVSLYLKGRKDVSVEVGRGGGVFKGGKPQRTDNRIRCKECNQVIRPDFKKSKSIIEDNMEDV